MSNDLISRSTLIEEFYKRVGGDLMVDDIKYFEKIIQDAPVAYELDRVVGQLRELNENEFTYARVMHIVKAGGADSCRVD